jgi:hypothetical protein
MSKKKKLTDDNIITTLDCKIKNVAIDNHILSSVDSINCKITEILWNLSLCSNYVINNLLSDGYYIPEVDRTFFVAVLYSITTSSHKGAISENTQNIMKYINNSINSYNKLKPPSLNRDNCSEILEVIIQDNFIQNIKLNVSENFYDTQKGYIIVNLSHMFGNILNNKLSLGLSGRICTYINKTTMKKFNFKDIGLFISKRKLSTGKWSALKKKLYSLSDKDKNNYKTQIQKILTINRKQIINILKLANELYEISFNEQYVNNDSDSSDEDEDEDEEEKVYKQKASIYKGMMKKYPHLFLQYLHNINKFYDKNKKFSVTNTIINKKKFKYTANKLDYKNKTGQKELKQLRFVRRRRKLQRKNNKDKDINEILDIINSEDDDFDSYHRCKKLMKCKNLMPIRSGMQCFITISNGHRLTGLLNHYFKDNNKLVCRYRYQTDDPFEKIMLTNIEQIDNIFKTILSCKKSNNFTKNIVNISKELYDLHGKLFTYLKNNKLKKNDYKLLKLYTKINKHRYEIEKTLKDTHMNNSIINSLIDIMTFLDNNWLFVEISLTKQELSYLRKEKKLKNNWWKLIFKLEDQYKQLSIKYMLTKKYHNRSIDVYNILGKYITTDSYQLKIQFMKSCTLSAANVSKLYDSGYTSIKCEDGKQLTKLTDRGIYDITDVKIDPSELSGRVLKGVDPGIASVLTWTEFMTHNKLRINSNDSREIDGINKASFRHTDKEVTNGDYQSSWFKGPYRIIEKQWRAKYKVEDIFTKLSKFNLNSSNIKLIEGYLKVLYDCNNYKKILNYKHHKGRLKWKYKRLLGKRSYIDKITNSLAYGKIHKFYGNKRKTYDHNSKSAIIFFGSAGFKTGMKNYSAVPRKSILRVLSQKAIVILTDEYNSTKNCFKCHNKLEEVENKEGNFNYERWTKSDLRNVRCCQTVSCNSSGIGSRFIINRDVNASINILYNGLIPILGGKQPLKHNMPDSSHELTKVNKSQLRSLS